MELIGPIFIYLDIYNRELLLTNTGRAIISSNSSSDLLNLKASKLCQLYFLQPRSAIFIVDILVHITIKQSQKICNRLID